MSKASREFRVELKEYADDSPVLILLSTDDYANSFPLPARSLLWVHRYMDAAQVISPLELEKQYVG
jgi:hypothetical protein